MEPTSGLTFGGRYQLSSRVAIGGMGEVWQATDLVIGRTVAIKILKDEYLGDPGFLERFRAEARHAALVNHEGIANVFDYGEEEGSAYLVMELVPGEALSAILERERVLATDRVLDFVAQTASALHAAHSAGLVHRDIKPGNLLITPDGRVKITDFGIARIADQVPLTATGQVMGTVQYLSPEQASGHPASPGTDIYSLGIVAYEALAGRRPFTGESQVAIAMAQINDQAPDLPSTVSEPVRNLVYSCISKSPAERPASAAHLARAAQALRRGDVAGATVAVPGVGGTGAMAGFPTADTQATRVLNTAPPSAAAAGATGNVPTRPTETKTRSPWTWPLIALIGILLVVLIGTIIALVTSPSDDDVPPTTPTSTRTTTPTPTETESTTVAVIAEDFIGKTREEAQALLDELSLNMNALDGDFAPDPSQENRVQRINPSGPAIVKGTTIDVYFYREIPGPTEPGAPSAPASFEYEDGTTGYNVTWPIYNGCPPGTNRTAYRATVSGAVVDTANPIPPNVQQVHVRPTGPGTVTFSYTVECAGIVSPSSPSVSTTVTEKAPDGEE